MDQYWVKVGGTVTPGQVARACHPRKEENTNQRSGTGPPCRVARPCHFSWRCFVVFWIVIRQFSFYLSSPSRIRRFLGFLGLSFCIVIELRIQERIDWLLSIDRCYRFSTLFTLFFYVLIRVSYCLACVCYWLKS